MDELDKKWSDLVSLLEKNFNDQVSLKGVLYLIGVQELNMGAKKFDRDEKADVLHVAVCKILAPFGYYKFDRVDEEGWPHWIEIKALKSLDEKKQERLMKKAIINYLDHN